MIDQIVSHYRVLRRLGGGGMGVVYEAEDLTLGRHVALKFLPDTFASEPQSVARLEREARAAAALNHPNICTVHEIGHEGGLSFIAMELMSGGTLKHRIGAHAMDTKEVVALGTQIADGLAAAHAKGIIHRDIKPANIFVTDGGQAKVLDFGLAKLLPEGRRRIGNDTTVDAEPLTAPAALAGTVGYMSPEQILGRTLDTRSDLFSFGVVLYEMATGVLPFDGHSVGSALDAVLHAEAVPARHLNSKVPPKLDRIIAKSLKKDPNARYQSAADLRADLEGLVDEPRVAGSGVATHRFRFEWFRSKRIAAAAICMLVVAIGITRWGRTGATGATAKRKSIAVLPFRSMNNDAESDFLRVALADEIATTLTYVPNLEIRPIPATQNLDSRDPEQVGNALRVTNVVLGHFATQNGKLVVTMQLIDVKQNNLMWQDTLALPSDDLLSMQHELQTMVRKGVVPRISAVPPNLESTARPNNSEAYDIYLRSTAMPHDTVPNRDAIRFLERSVDLDPNYAPAWDALGLRYYYEATYGGGGVASLAKAVTAEERAVAADPNYIPARGRLARLQAERGNLVQAYREAQALVARRADAAQSHLTMAYVLRYAGLLQLSTRECDIALQQDPGDYILRSCGLAYVYLGNTKRGMDYISLDTGSEWFSNILPWVLMREGNIDKVRAAAAQATDDQFWFGGLLQSCLHADRPDARADFRGRVSRAEPAMLSMRDPEMRYDLAAMLAFCGEREIALRLLRSAVAENFCAYDALQSDAALAPLRGTGEFRDLTSHARSCRERFVSATNLSQGY